MADIYARYSRNFHRLRAVIHTATKFAEKHKNLTRNTRVLLCLLCEPGSCLFLYTFLPEGLFFFLLSLSLSLFACHFVLFMILSEVNANERMRRLFSLRLLLYGNNERLTFTAVINAVLRGHTSRIKMC